MRKNTMLFAAVLCLLTISIAQVSFAAIYKYIDKEGQICLADDLQSIPEKFRSTAVIVQGESNDEPEPPKPVPVDKVGMQPLPAASLPDQASIPPSPELNPQTQAPSPLSYRLMISGMISLGLIVIFLVISKQGPLKENKKVLAHIRMALIGSISLFLVAAHIQDVMHLFGTAGKAINDVQQRQAEKGKKAAQAMKKLNELVQETQKMEESLKAGSGEGDDQK